MIAALVLFWSGFFTADFLLSGLYSWPRVSRVITLTLAVTILSYEFVYKDAPSRRDSLSGLLAVKPVVYFCLIPYVLGSTILLIISRLR
ncbi:MAG: hypothetical protein D6704_07685 [Nitrospirae bacterium]|nr:MAG: hypothetical protein D6704_07685 [Nitrospirota bacterium]